MPHDKSRQAAHLMDYKIVLIFIAVWVAAVFVAISRVDAPPISPPIWNHSDYSGTHAYTWSLALLYIPLVYLLAFWYPRFKDRPPVLKALAGRLAFTAGAWILLDILFANMFFRFPDPNAYIRRLMIPGYSWDGDCGSGWTLFNVSCYVRSIPLEEVFFYIGGGALLMMMYMWATEDFYRAYAAPREAYLNVAKGGPLVHWNRRLILIGLAILAAGVLVKKYGWWHDYHEGLPYYLFAELVLVFVPLSALYDRVRPLTNIRAFVFVLPLHALVSVVWETTLALPYGWWDYQHRAMMGVSISAWSNMPLEAGGLWLSVGWSAMFMYEATKVRIIADVPWGELLFGGRTRVRQTAALPT
jgi:hypothetical protein